MSSTHFAKAVAIAALAVGTSMAAAEPKYLFGQSTFRAGNGGEVQATGDFNGDGRLDLVVLEFTHNTLSVLLGTADGGFVDGPAPVPVGAQPQYCAVADFDGDGRLDVAMPNANCNPDCVPGTVTVLHGNGDGSFTAGQPFAAGLASIRATAADVNGDGKIDLVVANATSMINFGIPSTVSVYLSKGDGTFQTPLEFPAGNGVVGVLAANFDADPAIDLVAINSPSANNTKLSLLHGKGDGTFDPATDLVVGPSPVMAATSDLNGDQVADLAVVRADGNGNYNSTLTILLGKGDGTFSVAEYPVEVGAETIAIADLDGDGDRDLVVGVTEMLSGGFDVLQNDGVGGFGITDTYVSGSYGQLFAGDYDSDGRIDIATGYVFYGLASATVVQGHGDGTFAGPTLYSLEATPTAVAIGDVSSDAHNDLVVTTTTCAICPCSTSTVSSYLGQTDGELSDPVSSALPGVPVSVTLGDFDRDGQLDLVTLDVCESTFYISRGIGGGAFADAVQLAAEPGASDARIASARVAADFDGDGKLDFAFGNPTTSTVSILRGHGDGTFRAQVDMHVGPGASALAVGDFNSDGKLDIAAADTRTPVGVTDSGHASVLLGNGDGTFTATEDALTGTQALVPVDLLTADMTGDGKLDLVLYATVGDTEIGLVTTLVGSGDGKFALVDGKQPYVAKIPLEMHAADLDGDGHLDVAVTMAESNVLRLLRGVGDGTFLASNGYGTAVASSGHAIGDLNGDKVPDLVNVSPVTMAASVWLSGCPGFPCMAPVEGGMSDAGAGSPDGGQVTETEMHGCGCRAVGDRRPSHPGTLLLFVSLLALTQAWRMRRRRSLHSSRGASASSRRPRAAYLRSTHPPE